MEQQHHHPDHEPATPVHAYEVQSAPIPGISPEQHKRLFRRGVLWLGTGVALMGLSFCVNYCLFHSDQSFHFVMYAMTTAGAVCMTKGMGDILGF